MGGGNVMVLIRSLLCHVNWRLLRNTEIFYYSVFLYNTNRKYRLDLAKNQENNP